MPPIRVFVVADTRFYREGLAHRLGCEERCDVVGSARSAAAAVSSLGGQEADVVLVDLDGTDRLGEVRVLAAALPRARIVALGVPETERAVVACAEAGVAGYVPRRASVAELLSTVEQVRAGETPCPPHIAAGLFRRLASLSADGRAGQPAAPLTRREEQILALIDEGRSNKEIARELQIEVPTVKNHVHHILEKLHVHRRGEAAARANGRVHH